MVMAVPSWGEPSPIEASSVVHPPPSSWHIIHGAVAPINLLGRVERTCSMCGGAAAHYHDSRLGVLGRSSLLELAQGQERVATALPLDRRTSKVRGGCSMGRRSLGMTALVGMACY